MFGFMYRLCLLHTEDEENPLVYLQLSSFYELPGIYISGQSYMIRSETKKECVSMWSELKRRGEKLLDRYEPRVYIPSPGYYTNRQQKEMYIVALIRYLDSKDPRMDEFYQYITDKDKKLAYLHEKLKKLHPYFTSQLFSTTVRPGKQRKFDFFCFTPHPIDRYDDSPSAGFS